MLITSEIVKHQIDIVNPYIKLLGTTDIMSDSKEKTPTESPERDGTGAIKNTTPSEKDKSAEMEKSLRNQQSWFLKQNLELLKLLDRLHHQEYNEVGHQEEEILDRISDFTLVLFEYVKILKKRMERGAVCV